MPEFNTWIITIPRMAITVVETTISAAVKPLCRNLI
jgi:hypothetical protein